MTRSIVMLTTTALVVAGALAATSGASTSGELATASHRWRTLRLVASTTASTTTVSGVGMNLHVGRVRANGHDLDFGDGAGSRTATMYGDGVIVRFTQRQTAYSVSVVAITGHPVIAVRYSVSR